MVYKTWDLDSVRLMSLLALNYESFTGIYHFRFTKLAQTAVIQFKSDKFSLDKKFN
jgi:hypothetical protein